MNATAIGVQELTCQLLDTAAGIPADTAAAGLIIGHFLHRDAFRRTITAGTSICTGQPLELPRVFRTGNSAVIYAAACISSSSSMTSCGVL
jgi:hypothetical protein